MRGTSLSLSLSSRAVEEDFLRAAEDERRSDEDEEVLLVRRAKTLLEAVAVAVAVPEAVLLEE